MDWIAVADGGPAVIVSIFDNPDEYIGKKVGLSGANLVETNMQLFSAR